MRILIFKKDEKALFNYGGEDLEFNYENLNGYIDYRLDNISKRINFETTDELKEYEELLTKLDEEITNKDFIDAVALIKEEKTKLNKEKGDLDDEKVETSN